MKKIPKKIIDQIIKDKKIRIRLARESHELFFSIYLPHYLIYPSAPFHEEFFNVTEDIVIKHAVITAFRGSGKSTVMTFSYPLWSILGKQQKKFILILGHTIYQARIYMKNIKEELESNDLLRADLGPFKEENEWQSYSVVIPRYNARIVCASYEQGIRGLRHRQYRPDLIICDDVEDLESVRTQESRDKTYRWLTGDVVPSGDQNTRLIIIGNLLHEDSLLMRLREKIEEGQFDGIYREYPFMDENDNVLWKSKFPTQETIDSEKRKIGNEIAWLREYMLKIIPESDAVIDPKWIQRYGKLPPEDPDNSYYIAAGIDLAISEKENRDYTGIVLARIYGRGEDLKIYVTDVINKRMNFPKTLETVKNLFMAFGNGQYVKMYAEDVAYQRAFTEALQKEHYPVEGVPTKGIDKRSRLTMITPAIKNGTVLFPKNGVELLINQLIGFGVEKHDDLVDALVMLVTKIVEENRGRCGSFDWINDEGTGTIMGNLRDKDF